MRIALNRYVRKFGKILLWFIGIIVAIVGLAFLLIQVPYIQDQFKKRVVLFLHEKLKTDVAIERLSFDFPKRLVLEGVYFADQKGDTLLAGDTLKVDIAFLKLLSNQVMVHEIDLRGITAYVDKNLIDSTYNFDYIIKAFIREEDKDTPPVDSTAALRFSVSKINLDRIRIKFNNEVTGNDVTFYLRHFDTKIEDFDLDNNTFNIPKINLSGLNARLRQTKALSRETVTADTLHLAPSFTYPDLKLEEINLSDISIDYGNTVTAIDTKVDLDSLQIKIDHLDMQDQKADLQLIKLKNTGGYFALGETAQEAIEATASEIVAIVEKGWIISLAKLDLENIAFKFDDLAENKLTRGIDYNHIDLKDLHGEVKDVLYSSEKISGKVNQLTFTEASGLDLKKFQADFYYSKHSAQLNNVYIETPRSLIRDQIQITYPSIETIAEDIGTVGIDLQLKDNKIAVSDLLLFAPSLAYSDPFRKNQNAILLVDGNVSGKLSELAFYDLSVSGLGTIKLSGSGNISGLPNVNRSYFNLHIDHLSANGDDIVSFLSPGTIPTSIRVPEYLELNGTFKGTTKSFTTDFDARSSFGAASIKATLKNITVSGKEVYDVNIQTHQFDLGKFIKKEEKIGKISFTANIKGTGTDLKTATAQIEGRLVEAEYNSYNYQNLNLKGNAVNGNIDLIADMADPNISFDLEGQANLDRQFPQLNFILNVDSINLQKLNFYEEELRFHGQIVADLQTADPDHLNGTIALSNSIIALSGKRYHLDTMHLVSVATETGDTLDLTSEFLLVHAKGNYNLTQIVPAFLDNLHQYIDLNPGLDTTFTYEPQQIVFTAQLIRSPLIEQLLPELSDMEDAKLSGNFDSQTGEFRIEGGIPRLRYRDYVVDGLDLDIHTENAALNYALTFDQLSRKELQVLNTSLSGKAQDNILSVNLVVRDVEEKERYRIAGDLTTKNDLFEFTVLPDGLLLDYRPWKVSSDNSIQFGKEGMMVRNLTISNGVQLMSVKSTPPHVNAPLDVTFKDFKIETFTRLVTKDSLLAGGVINGTALVRDLKTNLVFSSDLTIEDFSFHGDTVGNIALHVNNEKPDTYAAKATITGYGNEVNIDGFYFVNGEKSNYDLDVNIETLNLKSIEGFTMGEIDDATGAIAGNLKITGSSLTPDIRGDLRLKQAGFNITRFNSYYRAEDERMQFTSDGVVLDNFTLIDSAGNEAVVDGTVFTKDYKDFRFALNVRADNFQVLNSTRDNNKLYYGQLFIDSRMKISGGFDNPVVDGSIRVKENTRLTVVIPQSDPGIIEREGIVEFVDMDTLQFTILTSAQDSLNQTDVTGMDVSVIINIDKDAELNLIIDEANGDYLRVRGTGELTGGIDPSGKITLTGTYELDQGAYSFSFNQIKREFLISKGSSITWTGEPMKANVNVTAIYTAETAPLSLVQNQLSGAEQNVVNTYKQKLPFQLLLTMKGELLKPDITFDIRLPEKNYGVSNEVVSTVNARLTELRTMPSELNKQVFAILLLNRFISEDPFQNTARGGGISSLARQSASKLLSEQLNKVVGGMIAGFNLNFDINSIEDYTSGELKNRTDLTIGVSKRLLDDRLNINIGSQFELEGPKDTNRKSTNIAGDVSAEYQLSKDGRYLVRAYRKNEYIVLQGQVVESGLGFVFTVDYEKFKDIFVKKTEEQKITRKQEREAKKEALKEKDE